MQYKKPPISFHDQIQKLKQRGLLISDEKTAIEFLSSVSYYRLRAYTYPFQDNDDPNHPFIKKVNSEEIKSLYEFDRDLSHIVFEALEKIEIAIRTQIIYHWAILHGSHWQINPTLYRDHVRFANQIAALQGEINRSDETFIDHYRKTYSNPTEPPSWMSLEVASFGLLSQLFLNLRKGPEKIAVIKHFGLNDISIMESWMHCFSNIRNICAHHGRLWNRRLTAHIKLPSRPAFPFLTNSRIYPYKLYAAISCMLYLMNVINPSNNFRSKIKEIMTTCPLAQEKEMGFPSDWKTEKFWQ